VEGMAHNSEDFIARLYKALYEKLFRIAYRMLGDTEQAGDAVQDVFLQAVFHRSKLAEHPNPEGWLVTTLKNNIYNERRRSMAHQIVPLDDAAPVAEAEPETPLAMILPQKLPQADRDILIWRFEQDLDYREIADRLGISEGNSRIRVHRAIERCRKLFKSG
jgi:RNA polymerase sigma-70 factor (ECF subfamily)